MNVIYDIPVTYQYRRVIGDNCFWATFTKHIPQQTIGALFLQDAFWERKQNEDRAKRFLALLTTKTDQILRNKYEEFKNWY